MKLLEGYKPTDCKLVCKIKRDSKGEDKHIQSKISNEGVYLKIRDYVTPYLEYLILQNKVLQKSTMHE